MRTKAIVGNRGSTSKFQRRRPLFRVEPSERHATTALHPVAAGCDTRGPFAEVALSHNPPIAHPHGAVRECRGFRMRDHQNHLAQAIQNRA